MLCSVVKHLGSSKSTQEVGRNTRLRLMFPPTLLSCSNRFLRAPQQNRAQPRLLYLLNSVEEGKECVELALSLFQDQLNAKYLSACKEFKY